MNKYLTKKFAKILLLIGFIIFIIGLIFTNIALFSSYDLVGKCPANTINCQDITWQENVVKTGSYVTATGYYVLLVGVIDLVVAFIRKK